MVSVSTCFNYDFSVDQQVKMIQEVGFDCLSTSGKYSHNGLIDNTETLIHLIRESSICVDTVHGCSANDENVLEILERCCYFANQVGSKVVVVHPCSFFLEYSDVDEKLEDLLNITEQMVELSKKYGIKFALENLHPDGATELLIRALDLLDEEHFGLCYDIAHAQIDGPRECQLLKEYGHRIIAVHISDRIRPFVDHVVPGEGFIDFDPLINKLVEIKYSGSILMEVLSNHTQYKSPKDLLLKTYEAGRLIENRLNTLLQE